jgi:homocysteine S-methyltransferase
MNIIETYLKNYPFIVLDGALATELELMNFDLSNGLWSAKVLYENPSAIKKVHRNYLDAGADCIITASYQATITGFVSKGYTSQQAEDIIKFSVKLAKDTIDEYLYEDNERILKPFVAGSAGSYGAYLANGSEYRGDYKLSKKEYISFHKRRVELLIEAGSDIIAFETLPRLDEAAAVLEMMEEFKNHFCWIVFSAKDNSKISDGELFTDCVKELNGFDSLAAVGINCSSPSVIKPLISDAMEYTGKPMIVYPNSGEVFNIKCSCWKGLKDNLYIGDLTREWYESGAKIIGGCCQIGPDQIKQIYEFRKSIM